MSDEPQFNPDAIKAEYLAKQHNINRADYLKDGISDQEFISEYGDKPIGGPVSTEPDTSKYIPTPETQDSGGSSDLIGAGLGLAAAKAADPYIGAAYGAKYLYDKAPEIASKLGEAFHKGQSMGDKWTFGSEPGVGGVTGNMGPGGDSVTKAAQNYRMQRDLPSELSPKYGVNRESIIVPKDVAAEEQAARLAAEKSISGRVSQAVKAASSGLPRKILGTALPWLTFPIAGAEAWDASKKYAPDKDLLSRQNIQAGISGLGALGTLASTYPSVPTTVIGGGMGAAAPIVNKMIDMAYSQTPEQFWKPVKSGISSEELSKILQPGYGTQKLIHKADGGPVLSYPMGGGLNYTMPGFAEGGSSDDAKNFQLSTGALEDLLAGNSDISHFLPQAAHDLTHMPKSIDPNNAEDLAMNFAGAGITRPFVPSKLLKEQLANSDWGTQLFKNPVHLSDGSKLRGFNDRNRTTFIGADKNNQPFSIGREFVDPASISHSTRDNNAIANHIRDMVSSPLSAKDLDELRRIGNGSNGSRLNSQNWE